MGEGLAIVVVDEQLMEGLYEASAVTGRDKKSIETIPNSLWDAGTLIPCPLALVGSHLTFLAMSRTLV